MPHRRAHASRHIVTLGAGALALAVPLTSLGAQAAPRPLLSRSFYSVDGSGNNALNPSWGAAGSDLLRLSPARYSDGISSPAGADRPSARVVSNLVSSQADSIDNDRNLSDMIYVFGQFLDHDLSLTPDSSGDSFPIQVPSGDVWFDPASTGMKTIGMSRSQYDQSTGTSGANVRQQVNTITSFIDGSQVYGSDAQRAAALRTFSQGQLRTSAGNMLPFNTDGLDNANDAHMLPGSSLFLTGDRRANENPELVSLQTLFVREHNRIAAQIAGRSPNLSDEQIYQQARRVVIAELQSITYNEFLPALLGPGALAPYRGYRPKANPGIATEFSTAAYRFGHSLLDGEINRLNDDGSVTPQGVLELRDSFFNTSVFDPTLPGHEGDIDPFLKGSISGNAQEVDTKVVDDLRNFLFGPPGSGGFDLAALNIQRGRDHGLADYNSVRAAYGLPRVRGFAAITPDPVVQGQLKQAYGSVDKIDLWVGGLAEKHQRGASVGPLFARIIADQFTRLRDGDRLFYLNTFAGPELGMIQHVRLADVIKANTSLTNVQPNVFFSLQSTPQSVR